MILIRRASMVFLLSFLGGCLYLGGINRAPRGEIVLVNPENELRRGEAVVLRVEGHDDDGDILSRAWRMELVDDDGARRCSISRDGGLCEEGQPPAVFSEEEKIHFVLPLDFAGSYRVEVTCELTDGEGATSVARRELVVKNAAPKVHLRVNGVVPQDAYARHVALRISAAASEDEAGDLACDSKATIRWARDTPGEEEVALWKVMPCKGEEVLDKLLVKFHPSEHDATFVLRVEVEDRWGTEAESELRVRVMASEAPCVRAMRPALAAGEGPVGAIVMEGAPLTLAVLETSPTAMDVAVIRWASSAQLAGPYVDLSRQPGARLSLSATELPVGQRRFYRARVEGPLVVATPACRADVAHCAEASAASAACYRWVTWEVMGR